MLNRITSGRSVLELGDKQVIFAQGDPAGCVFYVSSGRVKLTVVSNSGREAVIALLEPGVFFGEVSLMGGRPRFTTGARTLGKCTLIRIEKQAVARLLRDDPQFAERFVAHLVARNVRAQDDLINQLFNPAEKRLARLLLLMANLGSGEQTHAVIPRISQETLAQMIGADRSRVSVFMNRFKKLGFIDYNGEIRIQATLRKVWQHE